MSSFIFVEDVRFELRPIVPNDMCYRITPHPRYTLFTDFTRVTHSHGRLFQRQPFCLGGGI